MRLFLKTLIKANYDSRKLKRITEFTLKSKKLLEERAENRNIMLSWQAIV